MTASRTGSYGMVQFADRPETAVNGGLWGRKGLGVVNIKPLLTRGVTPTRRRTAFSTAREGHSTSIYTRVHWRSKLSVGKCDGQLYCVLLGVSLPPHVRDLFKVRHIAACNGT